MLTGAHSWSRSGSPVEESFTSEYNLSEITDGDLKVFWFLLFDLL